MVSHNARRTLMIRVSVWCLPHFEDRPRWHRRLPNVECSSPSKFLRKTARILGSLNGWPHAPQPGAQSGSLALKSHELAVETTYKQHDNGASEAVFNLVPGPGTHYFKYRGSWFQV
jgi:hypothetical protein